MKKLFLTSALALAITAGASAPTHAKEAHQEWIVIESISVPQFISSPFSALIGLLLPAVQSAPSTR